MHYGELDPAIEARVDELLKQMTLAEKVGQLVQVTPFVMPDPDELAKLIKQAQESSQPVPFAFRPRPGLDDQIRAGRVGSIFNLPDAR